MGLAAHHSSPGAAEMGTWMLYNKLLLLINIINSDLRVTHNPAFQHESYLRKSSKWKYSVLTLRSPESRSKEFQSSIKKNAYSKPLIKEIQKWLLELLFIPQK